MTKTQVLAASVEVCEWRWVDAFENRYFLTQCHNTFYSPKHSIEKAKFCCYCGKAMREVSE